MFLKEIWSLVKYNHFSFYLIQKIHWAGLNLVLNLPLKNLTPKMLINLLEQTLTTIQSCNNHVFGIISMSFNIIKTNLTNWKFRWCWIAWTIIVVFTIIFFIGQRLKILLTPICSLMEILLKGVLWTKNPKSLIGFICPEMKLD